MRLAAAPRAPDKTPSDSDARMRSVAALAAAGTYTAAAFFFKATAALTHIVRF